MIIFLIIVSRINCAI